MTLRVDVKRYGRGYWLYIPKKIYELLDEPEFFEIVVKENKLILIPGDGDDGD